MISSLCGTWTLESGENINEYLKQLGMAVNKRKVEVTKKPAINISQLNSEQWCITIDMKNKGTETIFKEGEDVDTSNELKFVFDQRFYFDARRKCRSVFKFENPNKLVQKTNFNETGETQIIIREINQDGDLVEDLDMNGVKAKRFFKRA